MNGIILHSHVFFLLQSLHLFFRDTRNIDWQNDAVVFQVTNTIRNQKMEWLLNIDTSFRFLTLDFL